MRKILIIVLLIVSILSFVQGASATKPVMDPELLNKLKGIWLRTEYLDTLNLTKAPVKSVKNFYEVEVIISEEKGRYYWFSIYNFHEGVKIEAAAIKNLANHQFEVMGKEVGATNPTLYKYKFKISTLKKLQIMKIADKGKYLCFKKVKAENESFYVNKVVLVGRYYDAQGNQYLFSDDMTARWPNGVFRYRINIDPVFSDDDYICLVDENEKNLEKYYAFEWKGKRLYLYHAKPTLESVKKVGKPILVLRRAGLS